MTNTQDEISRQWDECVALNDCIVQGLLSLDPRKIWTFCAILLERYVHVGVEFSVRNKLDIFDLQEALAATLRAEISPEHALICANMMDAALGLIVDEELNDSPSGRQACYYYSAFEIYFRMFSENKYDDLNEFMTCFLEVPIAFLQWNHEGERGLVVMDDYRSFVSDLYRSIESRGFDEIDDLRHRQSPEVLVA